MSRYRYKSNTPKEIIIKGIIITIIIAIIIFIFFFIWYKVAISAIGKNDENKTIEIQMGTTVGSIAKTLKDNNLIKNEFAFKLYVKIHKIQNFQAGKYLLNQKMNVNQIIQSLQKGVVYEDISITFLEGKNIRWYANKIEEKTNNTVQDVYKVLENEEYIDSIINKYWFLTENIKDKDIYYPLEGYLFPDTYTFKNADVSVEEIFDTLLAQTDKVLSKYRQDIEKTGYTIHELITIASIVEMEGAKEEDRNNIASVIYNRLNMNMSLGIDSTTYYASKIEVGSRDLYQSELNSTNPYNTRGLNMEGKIPIGPISSVSEASIKASIYPNKTEFLYFSSDKNRNVYFSKTIEEHEKMINKLKAEGKWYEF